MEIYQDRICFVAGEENGLGRFLKEHGKSDKTRVGKMIVAAGKTNFPQFVVQIHCRRAGFHS